MEFCTTAKIINVENFISALKKAILFVPKRSKWAVPSLQNILLNIQKKSIIISSHNLEAHYEATIDAHTPYESYGGYLLRVEDAKVIVKHLSKARSLDITLDGTLCHIHSEGKIWNFRGSDCLDEYPKYKYFSNDEHVFQIEDLDKALLLGSFCAPEDSYGAFFDGSRLKLDNEYITISCQTGFRVSEYKIAWIPSYLLPDDGKSLFITKAGIKSIFNFLKKKEKVVNCELGSKTLRVFYRDEKCTVSLSNSETFHDSDTLFSGKELLDYKVRLSTKNLLPALEDLEGVDDRNTDIIHISGKIGSDKFTLDRFTGMLPTTREVKCAPLNSEYKLPLRYNHLLETIKIINKCGISEIDICAWDDSSPFYIQSPNFRFCMSRMSKESEGEEDNA